MSYSKPQIVSVSPARKSIQGSITKQQHNVKDGNPMLQESTLPAYEADE